MTKTIADLMEDRFGLPVEAGRDMPAEGDLAHILGHRSHRRYKPDPVAEDLLEVLLAALEGISIHFPAARFREARARFEEAPEDRGADAGDAVDRGRARLHGFPGR